VETRSLEPNASDIRNADARDVARRWRFRFLLLLGGLIAVIVLIATILAVRLTRDSPVVHQTPEEHFKYGSTGGERESGFPLWVFQALPQVCAHHLPGGYSSLGLIYEPGKELPIGMSLRNHMGIDRTFLNCSVCHVSTVRDTPAASPRIVLGMPANRLDIMGFERFLFACGADPRFSTEFIIPEARRLLQQKGEDLSLIDRYVVYPLAIWITRERLMMLRGRFGFVEKQVNDGLLWGPGRVDTFNSAKVLFNFPMDKLDPKELGGPADFPSIWNQRAKRGMQLHWDGNNTMVEERNKSAAFGTGTTPPTIDLEAIGRIENWLLDFKPPPYPYPVDATLAQRGAPIYQKYCAACHGANGQDFKGDKVGTVTPIADIATDRGRLDSYTYELAVNQSALYAGYPHRFQHFRKTFGYANMPLDGLWLRAPYLHNGSVPTLRDLLEPAARRPAMFYRGYDVYDPVNVGFVSNVEQDAGRKLFRYDTKVSGNSNAGHDGPAYGTELPASDKAALLEFLKTF
jgi:Cytochrome C oxidase, cbb3-type, subunit III